ncbi:Uncharacterised protein [Moraxella lacunata]|uniref:Uncharacterized protein n=1 Tax=Moraxella lacunata TaxID=477 RepID=A0A378T4F1_MORLA|nr:hypothetical protein [Moraxella lacunata]STZ55656.1 Uncharacterised protein [Moraxella lacunata]STZ55669.1 Uncharacterised protein [Moraxella lacunata]
MMTFQEFLDNPNVTAIDFENGYVEFGCPDDDETLETKPSFPVTITLTIEQSLYIARVLTANNSGRVHDVQDYDVARLINDANFKAITDFYGKSSAPACLEH